MTVKKVLSEHTREIQELTYGLREVLRETLPHAEERVYPVWHGIGYVDKDAGYVCGLFPKRDCVEIGFEHGWDVPDPDELFERSGKQVRYVAFTGWDPERVEQLRELVERAKLVRA